MSRKQLVANKAFSYSTRRLQAGDHFDCSERDAKVLLGLKLARKPREVGDIAAPSPELAGRLSQLDHDHKGGPGGSTGAVEHMRALRAEYQRVVGKRPFSGWDAAELTRRMAAAGQ